MRRICSLVVVLLAMPAHGQVVEFERDAAAWLEQSDRVQAFAFDEFFPASSTATDVGCLLDEPDQPIVFKLEGISITLSALDADAMPLCAIQDSAGTASISDAIIESDADTDGFNRIVMEFDPPIVSLYTFFGSIAQGETATMTLFHDEELMAALETPTSTHSVAAIGHGFIADGPVDRVEFTKSLMQDRVTVGAFLGLAEGEASLGTVRIPEYPRPHDVVELDLAFEIFVPCPADVNGSRAVDVDDLLMVILGFGAACPEPPEPCADVNGDQVVDVDDILELILAWGPCE
ncbi:MAG: hypothetical protein ACYTGC_09595 [Planctomycetota bacterium]|jgi:hypothetical protein